MKVKRMNVWNKTTIEEKEKRAKEVQEIWTLSWTINNNEIDWINFFETLKNITKEKLILRGLSQSYEGEWKVFISHMDLTLGSGNGLNANITTALNEAIKRARVVIKNNEKFRERVKNKKDALEDFMNPG